MFDGRDEHVMGTTIIGAQRSQNKAFAKRARLIKGRRDFQKPNTKHNGSRRTQMKHAPSHSAASRMLILPAGSREILSILGYTAT